MAIESSVPVNAPNGPLFIGETRTLQFEYFAAGCGPLTEINPATGAAYTDDSMANAAGIAFEWGLRKETPGANPYLQQGALLFPMKVSGTEITITGVYNSARASNTQRINVFILSADTVGLKAGTYVQGLKRTTAGNDPVISYGIMELLLPASR